MIAKDPFFPDITTLIKVIYGNFRVLKKYIIQITERFESNKQKKHQATEIFKASHNQNISDVRNYVL